MTRETNGAMMLKSSQFAIHLFILRFSNRSFESSVRDRPVPAHSAYSKAHTRLSFSRALLYGDDRELPKNSKIFYRELLVKRRLPTWLGLPLV